ncbi:MAG: hypothetical protein NTY61_04015 [Candidatus Parcubacteria bacterium]|nr:hypothetical protein [Candidatus Parcubacteria bacterium]
MLKNTIVVLVVLVVAVGVGSFCGGMSYGKNLSKGPMSKNFNMMGQRGDVANRAGGAGAVCGFVSGEVISQDGQSITVKLKDTGTKIVFFSTSTQIMKTSTGSISDIAVGSNLTITGKANADGSVIAQSIQIRPNVQQ